MDSNNRRHSLVSEPSALLLRAISHNGPEGVDAFLRWRALTPLDEAGRGASRVLPLLVDLVEREGLKDAEVQRIKGVGRHVWTQNTLNVRILLSAVDALAANGLRPMLLKGLALFVRSPDFMRKRSSTDGDILLPPEQIELAARLLREAGFEPRGFRWQDFGAPLIESPTSGASLRQPGQKSPLDLHWRPLSNITDPELGQTVMARAERHELQGRPILLPSVTDQLFLALARCEPWDEDESLTRLVEAHLLLSAPSAHVDWPALEALVTRYGLEAAASAFLGDLTSHTRLAVPDGLLSRFDAAISGEKSSEWGIRTISPDRRTEPQRWTLQRTDELARRVQSPLELPGAKEVRLRRLGLNQATAGALWEALRRRVRPGEVRDIQFLEGFSYPETEGRWSTGYWSAIAMPLTPAQQAGERVRLNAAAFLGAGTRARVAATGGLETVSRVQARGDKATQLDLKVRPLAELGGAGLILLWLPDATTPARANLSNDDRQLGLFIRWPWRLPARKRATGPRAAFEALRETYRHLPLPPAVRSRLSPALSIFQGQVAKRVIPPLLPVSSIKAGDVVVSGFLSNLSGIARAGRLTRDSLLTWGVPLSEHDIGADLPGDLVPEVAPAGIWICHCNPPEAMVALLGGPDRLWADRYRIGVWAYELEQLPDSWVPALACFHEIWAPSQFVADAILRARGAGGPVVRVVPHPLPRPTQQDAARRPRQPFMFLSMFDARSTTARKNPMGAIKAFQAAFDPTSLEVKLLVKVVYSDAEAAALQELHETISGWPNISLMSKHLTDAETLALIGEADCLVSLHRSEGFGLPIAEAMSVGTPTIITGWSAPVEFSRGAAIEINYDLVPASDGSGRYEIPGQVWADARLDHAAHEMRRLVADPERWADLSATGLRLAHDHLARPIAPTNYRRFMRHT